MSATVRSVRFSECVWRPLEVSKKGERHSQIHVLKGPLRLHGGRRTEGTSVSSTRGQRAGDLDEAGSRGTEQWSPLGSVWEVGLAKLAHRMDKDVRE